MVDQLVFNSSYLNLKIKVNLNDVLLPQDELFYFNSVIYDSDSPETILSFESMIICNVASSV